MANYIDNTKFELYVHKYVKGDKTIENELMEMFSLLIDNIFAAFNFNLDPEDAKQDCLLHIIKILNTFDESKGNAFNYFTTVILNNLRLNYTKNKIYNEKLENYFKRKSHLLPYLGE